MRKSSETYNIKMLNGLVIKDLSRKDIDEGIEKGKFLPSDFISGKNAEWIHLKDSDFKFKSDKKINGWMMLFYISFIINILMLLLIYWQNGRIQSLAG
jgi:hypothetical protein